MSPDNRHPDAAAFESAYAKINGSTPNSGWADFDWQAKNYYEPDVRDAWLLWQAARSTLKSA